MRTENDQHSFSIYIEDDVVGHFLIGVVRTIYHFELEFDAVDLLLIIDTPP